MEKNFEKLIETISSYIDIEIKETNYSPCFIIFETENEKTLNSIYSQIEDIPKTLKCNITNLKNNSYKISIDEKNKNNTIILLKQKILIEIESLLNKLDVFGLPDLSLVTIRQMANELKKRPNVVFALVWIENSEKDNIAVEGSGDPTQLIGLLARGTHMTIEWLDKKMKNKD